MKLDSDFFECAISHICTFGDTDIFPFPFELKFLDSCKTSVAAALSNIDISQYHPISLVEALAPKSKFGFRVAHQPFPVDTVIYTALVLRIFDSVETA